MRYGDATTGEEIAGGYRNRSKNFLAIIKRFEELEVGNRQLKFER